MAKKVVKCSRCGKRMRRMDGWNAVFKNGSAVAFVCPDCQTEAESIEAEVNAATLDYQLTQDGRVRGRVKACEGSTIECERCGAESEYAEGWAIRFADGLGLALVCPDCLTEWERLEMAVNASMLESDSATCGLYPVEAFAGAGE